MFYPKLKRLKSVIARDEVFGGLQQTEKTSDGFFSHMENLSVDRFPLMSVRAPRALWKGVTFDDTSVLKEHNGTHSYYGNGITAAASVAGHFCLCSSRYIYIDGRRVAGFTLDSSVTKRSIIAMGKDILIMPDEILVKKDEKLDYISERLTKVYEGSGVSCNYCDLDGTEIPTVSDALKPYDPTEKAHYVEGADGVMQLMEYSESDGWQAVKKIYGKIKALKIEDFFSVGDHIFVSEKIFRGNECTVVRKGNNCIIVDGILDNAVQNCSDFVAEKKPPAIDFAIEHNNRIWACRYGISNSGEFVNEIYASVPGDPSEWFCFEGTAMDSYQVSLGCSGEFTGAAVQGNDILFFKEDHIIKISGDAPSDFTVQSYPANGVEKGSCESIVNADDLIFYKSREGIMCYDGTYPVLVSRELGLKRYHDVAGGFIKGKYYAAMTDETGNRSVFVYSPDKKLWYRENDDGDTRFIVRHGGCLYFVTRLSTDKETGVSEYAFFLWDSSYIPVASDILGNFPDSHKYEYVPQGRVKWFASTGKLGDGEKPSRQILRNILITLSLGRDSVMEVYILPDSAGERKRLCVIESPDEGAFSVPVAIPPCHSFVLIFEGKGDAVIHSVTRKSEITGEVRNYGTK